MSYLRAAARLIAVTALSVSMYFFILLADLVLRVPELSGRSPQARPRWRARLFRRWARWAGRAIGMRTTVHGSPPQVPFLLVANHLSYVDIVLLAAELHCVFVAKADVARWPLIGRLCRAVDTLFIDRGNKRDIPRVMRDVERILQTERGVVIFPEGTSSDGGTVLPFRPSLLADAARSGRPVSYATLGYRTAPGLAPASRSICWWGDMEFPGHFLRLLGLPGFEASVSFGPERIREDDRKRLAERLQRAVADRLEPVV